jgi:hypothetical protein
MRNTLFFFYFHYMIMYVLLKLFSLFSFISCVHNNKKCFFLVLVCDE